MPSLLWNIIKRKNLQCISSTATSAKYQYFNLIGKSDKKMGAWSNSTNTQQPGHAPRSVSLYQKSKMDSTPKSQMQDTKD